MRCTLKSLGFHADRAGIAVRGGASAAGVVTRREEDGRFAFVEVECSLDVELEPPLDESALPELLDLAERDCFVGASLTTKPRYEWRVNGEVVAR
jgi:organic hydroperoxide reductase OsmC/OhrA